ncbi:MAG: restriction endonuclease [Verrucomicrobiaceae bacterium]|nr:MAG: restriction endonuclease [Verrucomicrobiaceae bacterium]
MNAIVVREHARLTTEPVPTTLDRATIGRKAFDWLVDAFGQTVSSGARLVTLEGRSWLRLDNYVGLIEAPDGTQIEILPKIGDDVDDAPTARAIFLRMLSVAYDLPTRSFGSANVSATRSSVWEWTAKQFIEHLQSTIRRGLRSQYEVVSADEPFVRGRLRVDLQCSKPPWRLQDFSVEYDMFSMKTPENKLIRSTLKRLLSSLRLTASTRLALAELDNRLASIAPSGDIDADLSLWPTDRLSAHYRPIRPWCELVLRQLNPVASAGTHNAPSLLFPMERVFEAYVAKTLHRSLPKAATVRAQIHSRSLCRLEGRELFKLRPDIAVEAHGECTIFDTKWKRADGSVGKKFGIGQADMYQMFAYGHKYQGGRGDVCLIYPRTSGFSKPQGPFQFSDTMNAYAVPFDLHAEKAILPPALLKKWSLEGINVRGSGKAEAR